MFLSLFLVFNVLISITYQIPRCPSPKHTGSNISKEDEEKVATRLESWTPCDKQSVWELSGQFEGDIVLSNGIGRNGLRDERSRWPNAVVTYCIAENSFYDGEIDLIERGLKEIEDNSCVTFRYYEEGDRDYIYVQSSRAGCWSSVGVQNGGQALNLAHECFADGTTLVLHEFLHALGFFHQQSASNRDDYVVVHFENIEKNYTENFQKFSSAFITDFGVDYDYGSILHYGRYAFAIDDELPTITPKQEGVEIGKAEKMSDKDIEKLNLMYNCDCSRSYKSIRNVNATNVKEDKENDNDHKLGRR